MKDLIAFDLDGTLAESKERIDTHMADLLAELLEHLNVAIISGGDWPQFDSQVVSQLPPRAKLTRLFMLPTTGTKLYRYRSDWTPIYADVFSPEDRARIVTAFDKALKHLGLSEFQIWGEQIEDRGTQITFSGLGQQAPPADKARWDPDFAKRRALQQELRAALPDLSINIGGSTSIDVTRQGIDKAYGMRRLAEHSGIPLSRMLFFGDAIYPGGNDDPVRSAGIDAIAVRDVAETKTALAALLACMGSR